MTANLPTISVVVAVYNGGDTIEACLGSVFSQVGDPIDLVVIDGDSQDGTREALEGLDGRISYWESEPDRGVYDAWNKALVHVSGEWIMFLGADDELAGPDVMANAALALDAVSKHTRVAYGSIELAAPEAGQPVVVGGSWSELGPEFVKRMTLPHPAVFHRRALFEARGTFDDGYRIGGDYEFLLREVLDRDPVWLPDLVVVRMSPGGLSSRPENEAVILRENLQARYEHGLVRYPPALAPRLIRLRARDWTARNVGPDASRRLGNVYRTLARKPRL